MTTLCRSDWIETYGNQELRSANIDPLKLPTTSFEQMLFNKYPAQTLNSDLSPGSQAPLMIPPYQG